jgi:RND family efflux transporter MFP subunit
MKYKTWLSLLAILLLAGLVGRPLYQRLQETADGLKPPNEMARPVPVEVTPIELGAIERRRAFSGTLQAYSEFVVAPKVGGRIEQIEVDLADRVSRGQVVARLDNDEYVQAVRQAEADLAVARANLAEAQSLLKIAERELERVDKLRQRGVSSESQRDSAKADQLAKQAHVAVTRAQVMRAKAELETARIRLGYTHVTAGWSRGNQHRVVAERYVDEGETVSPNAQLLRIVELDPIKVVFFVTERDYALLKPGQAANLATDAYPGESFPAVIVRISPVFREMTRQAQVELKVENPELRLKPGLFARVDVVMERAESVAIVPEQALVSRHGQEGLFLVNESGTQVSWRPIQVGIRQSQRAEVIGEGLQGRVVVLGQQLLDDGSLITIDPNSKQGQQP